MAKTPCDPSKSRRLGGTYRVYLQGEENLILLNWQRGHASLRTVKRASCNGTSLAVPIRYRRIVVGPSLRRTCLEPESQILTIQSLLFLKTEAISTDETLVLTRAKPHRHIPEDGILHKSLKFITMVIELL
jgi:hypothetical protein